MAPVRRGPGAAAVSNPNKAKGSLWEVAIVAALRQRYWPHAERRALAGKNDRGDIAGLPLVVIEAKNHKTITLAAWMDELADEIANDGADLGCVWIKRRGKARAVDGYVVMFPDDFMELLRQAGY